MATSLGKVGIKNRGRFDASATYAAGEYVYYMGSTFIALQNLPAGMVPQHDGINWNFLAEGASVEQVLQNFAPIEDGATVSKAYPAGDYFLHEDVLYKTTTDIANGGAIIIGTNVIQTNIGEEMHALAKNFANEEDSATATMNYSVGQYVIYNEQFYKVTAAISAGQTLVPGTNIEATTVGTQLSALNDSLTNSLAWKNLSAVTGANAITIPSGWSEANIRLSLDGNRVFMFHVVKTNFDYGASTGYNLRSGYYANSGNNAFVAINLTTVTNGSAAVAITDAFLTGSDKLSTSMLQIRYK